MTREEQLKLCSICKNRKVDLKRGLVCSLTNDYAKFVDECQDYVVDQKECEKKELRTKEIEKPYQKKDLYNDIIFCLFFSFFSARSHGVGAFFIVLAISVLTFVLSNCLIIQYEKKKGERLTDSIRAIIKDIFAVLVLLLIAFAF